MRTSALVLLTCAAVGLARSAWSQPGKEAATAPPTADAGAAAVPIPPDPGPACKRVPSGKRILKLNAKPESQVADLINWMSMITCTPFVFSGQMIQGRKITVLSPPLMTLEEAYQLFISALASVDLAVEPSVKVPQAGQTLRVFHRPGTPPPASARK